MPRKHNPEFSNFDFIIPPFCSFLKVLFSPRHIVHNSFILLKNKNIKKVVPKPAARGGGLSFFSLKTDFKVGQTFSHVRLKVWTLAQLLM